MWVCVSQERALLMAPQQGRPDTPTIHDTDIANPLTHGSGANPGAVRFPTTGR